MKFRKKANLKIRWRDFRIIQNQLFTYVDVLSNEIGPRNPQHFDALTQASEYVAKQMNWQRNACIFHP